MKKIIATVLAAGLLCVSVFAQGFTVKKLVGKVSYESAPGVWTRLKNGDKISGETVVDVGLHSSLELTGEDGKSYTVKAMKKGAVDSLLPKSSGLRKSDYKTSKVAEDGGLSTPQSTASSRASEVKDELTWDEEETK